MSAGVRIWITEIGGRTCFINQGEGLLREDDHFVKGGTQGGRDLTFTPIFLGQIQPFQIRPMKLIFGFYQQTVCGTPDLNLKGHRHRIHCVDREK